MSAWHGAGRCDARLPRIGSLCTGYGGLDLGVAAALGGARLAWCADNDTHVRTVLTARFPGTPNLGDITTLDWRTAEPVEVMTAGFPCQDISSAGQRRGIEKGTHSRVWINIVEALRVLRPGLLVVENVAALRSRGLGRVLGDLAQARYDTVWCSLRASDVGAPHRRERVFIAAYPAGTRWPWDGGSTASEGTRPSGEPERCGLLPAAPDPDGPRQSRSRGARTGGEPPRQPTVGRPDLWLAASNTTGQRHRNCRPSGRGGLPAVPVPDASPDAQSDRRDEGQPEPARLQGRPHPSLSGYPDRSPADWAVRWGPYEPAIQRWEHILGRRTPAPTEPGRGGRPRLSPRFVEWMMGLPEGWVTGLGLPRTAQLRALGNGVVPQQAAHAIRILAALHVYDPVREDATGGEEAEP